MVEKNVTQRLFGRTVIDSLDLNQNAWYIDEEQVTVTAAQLNGTSILPATSQTVDVLNDDILFLDHSGSHAAAYDSIPDFVNLVCGAAANTALASSGGIITVTPSAGTMNVANDSLFYVSAAGVPAKQTLAGIMLNVATSGSGLYASAAKLSTAYLGAPAVGSVRFTGAGDCDAIQVGAVLYTRNAAAADLPNGVWTSVSGTANGCATSLAAAINGDTRNTGSTSYYTAIANTDTVHIFSKIPGGDVAITLTGAAPTEPSVLESLAEGEVEISAQSVMVEHTVTANDVETAVLVHIPLPIVPKFYIAQIRNATGGIRHDVTDQFTIGTLPNRIVLTANGATHVIAGDIITVFAQE